MDKPWSIDKHNACSPLRARPWLGHTCFHAMPIESEVPAVAGEPVSVFEDISARGPQTLAARA